MPGILELVSYTEMLLDPVALDKFRLQLMSCRYTKVSDSMVVMALLTLHTGGYISLSVHQYPSTKGDLIIIKRIK